MTLRLVRDEPPKPKRRKGARTPLLTPDEVRKFKAAMRGLHDAFGSWTCLADVMRAQVKTIAHMMRGTCHVSGDLVVRAMKASGLTLAELLGGPVAADRCRACGKVRAA